MRQRTTVSTGIATWLEQVLSSHDAIVVSSTSLKRGFIAPERMNSPQVVRAGNPVDAVLKASGRSWGGQRTVLLLEGRDVAEAIPSLASMQEAGRDLVATLWPSPSDLARVIRGVLDAELTLLSAGSMQETLDLTAAASRIATASGRPCLVLGSTKEGAWSMGHFEAVEMAPPQDISRSDRLDPFQPAGFGIPMTGRMVLKQQAARLAIEPDMDLLIEDALSTVSAATGRPLAAFSGSLSASARLIVPASMAPNTVLAGNGLQLTQLFPLPQTLTDGKPSDLRPAVLLPCGTGSDMRHPLVRAFDSLHGSPERRSGGLFRRTTGQARVRAPLTVLVDPGIRWTGQHVKAIVQALEETESESDLRLLDAGLAVETRVPAIEEAVHAARQAGFDPSLLDLPVPDKQVDEPELLIGARHPHAALALASRLLDRAEAGAVAAPVSMDPAGDALVFVRLSGVLTPDQNTRVLLPDPDVIGHRTLRHHLPESATILVPESTSGMLPHWMTERHRSLFVVAPEMDWLEAAFEAVPTTESANIRAHTEDDLLDAGARPPEEHHGAEASSSSREHFLRTLGHLQDMNRLDEAPADEWIRSSRTPSLVPRPNRWQNEARPIPTVMAERCTGHGACWGICPEAAITSRAFSIAELMTAASDTAPGPFIHLPRLMSAWISTAHTIFKKDDLGQYRNAGDLLSESIDRLLASAGVADAKAEAIRAEAAPVIERVCHQELIRSEYWFDDREKDHAGSGLVLALRVDPTTCTHCGLCAEVCPDQAIEDRVDHSSLAAFRQLDALPRFASERRPTNEIGQPGSLLTGPSSSAAFRAGSDDRANLNRTVIRLAVETETAVMRKRTNRVWEAVRKGLDTLEAAMQDTARDRIRINDFESFGRQLESAAGNVSEVLQQLLSTSSDSGEAPLTDLTNLHKQLSRLGSELGPSGQAGPALCVINSLVDRSDGLAPFPSNPFSASAIFLPPDQAVSVIPGLMGAWQDRLEEMARTLRQVRQTMDGTFEPESAGQTKAEDRSWARAHLPRILWIVDRCDHDMLGVFDADLPVHLCWLDGGPTLERDHGLRPDTVRTLLPDLALASTHTTDPIALLEVLEALASDEQGMIHVHAPDPARDGVPVSGLLTLVETAGAAGLFGETHMPSATLADWMLLQERFRSRFELIQRTDWSGDQMPVADWLALDESARLRAQPCVFQGTGKDEQRWIPDAAVLEASERWWRSMKPALSPPVHETRAPSIEPAPTSAPATADVPSLDPDRTEGAPTDVHARLTERLLTLSGFQSGGTSLKAWLASAGVPLEDAAETAAEDGEESGADTRTGSR